MGRRGGGALRGMGAGLLLLVAAFARAPSALALPPGAVAAPGWTIDKPASRIGFRATAAGKPFDGVFKRWDAQLVFDPADPRTDRLQVVVEAASAVTGDPARDALLPSAAWMGAARFPRVVFASRTFAPAGPGRYRVSGLLTLHGAARPLDTVVDVTVAHDRLTLSGVLPLDRRAFGVGPAGGDDASATVQVQVRLAARRSAR